MSEADGVLARIEKSFGSIDAPQWQALSGTDHPFMDHRFLAAMEASGSVGEGTGWQSAPITIRSSDAPDAPLVAALPAWLKSHSQGEYVFDHAWADAWHRAGGRYFPKLLIAAPFTPVTGPRLLVQDRQWALPLIRAAEQLVDNNGLSSAHANFLYEADRHSFAEAGWLMRSDTQFHWQNRDYGDFEGFLGALSSRKRKAIRKERATAQAGLDIVHLTGDAITEAHWDAFWQFYQDTGARKWGRPYLTREAFTLLGQSMGERILLILAYADGAPIAGALNLIGPDALYGRYWGALQDRPCLHFELCYYQAIDAALAMGLPRVEAGAQGEHKLARGYEPELTWSAHYISDPGFRAAVADFLDRERDAVAANRDFLAEMGPFKKGP